MSVEDFVRLVPPPEHPLEVGDPAEWPKFESELGTPLPSDYREFVFRYGTGCLGDHILIYNPFARSEYSRLASRVAMNRWAIEGSGDPDDLPFPLYPDSPGLMTWGNDENGNWYAWLTKGKPDSWPVVVLDQTPELPYDQFKLTMTEFLAKSFQHKIRCKHFFEGYPRSPDDFVFQPIDEE